MSYLAIGCLILAGVSKSKIISKYGKKAYDAAKKGIANKIENLTSAQRTKIGIGTGVGIYAGTIHDTSKKKAKVKSNKNKNPRLKVKKKK